VWFDFLRDEPRDAGRQITVLGREEWQLRD